MRLPILLLLAVGSIGSYRIELYNTASVPVTVQKMRNNVQSSVVLPAASNNNPSSWNMTGLGAQATVTFVVDNLLMQIAPSTTPNSIDASVWYLTLPTNATLNQKVFLPGQSPPSYYTFICNDGFVPAQCIQFRVGNTPLGPSTFLSTTITYDDNFQPFKIYYNTKIDPQ